MKKLMIVLSTLFFISTVPAFSNSGPWRFEPAPGFNAIPVKSDSVEILSEELIYDIDEEKHDLAEVTAIYTMKNVSHEDQKLLVAFPFVDGDLNCWEEDHHLKNITVTLDGNIIEKKIKRIHNLGFDSTDGMKGKGLYRKSDGKAMDDLSFEDILAEINQSANEQDYNIENDKENWDEIVELILFELTLQPDTEHKLVVSYVQEGGKDRHESNNAYEYNKYMYYYFLEPASYWSDFSNLSITIHVPEDYNITNCTLDLKESEGNTYNGYFEKLPEDNLFFEITKDKNMIDKFNNYKWLLLMVILSILIIILLLIHRHKKTKTIY